jgi:hypothetical protein
LSDVASLHGGNAHHSTGAIQTKLHVQARTDWRAEGLGAPAALAQLTTFVRCAKEDFLLQPVDAAVNLPAGSPSLPELLQSSNDEVVSAAKAVFEVMDQLGREMQVRYDSIADSIVRALGCVCYNTSISPIHAIVRSLLLQCVISTCPNDTCNAFCLTAPAVPTAS